MNGSVRDSLRVVTTRLSATPAEQLPAAVSQISRILLDCRDILSAPESQKTKTLETASLHKFRTQINSLLNGKSPEGRYAAAVLIKTAFDIGGRELLEKSAAAWVRGLLAILSKTDPPPTKKICVIALTKVFLLTQEFPTLIREITTPSLAPFITACLNIVAPKTAVSKPAQLKAQKDLLPCVLQSFKHLLPNHPNVFRTFLSQTHALLAPFVVSPVAAEPTILCAQKLWSLLHFSAPKQTAGQEWAKTVDHLISEAHATADLIFRAVVEEWKSCAGVIAQPDVPRSYAVSLGLADHQSLLGFPGWQGIHHGCTRLVRLLQLLQTVTQGHSASTVVFPAGKIIDMAARLLQVTAPHVVRAKGVPNSENLRLVERIDRDEKEALWAHLPLLHTATLDLLDAIVVTFGSGAISMCESIVDTISYTFSRERRHEATRMSIYRCLASILEIIGPSVKRESSRTIDPIIKSASRDMLPHASMKAEGAQGDVTNSAPSINADTMLSNENKRGHSLSKSPAPECALVSQELLSAYLATVPSYLQPSSTRAAIDRAAVLSQDRALMSLSVLNPPHSSGHGKGKSSILPHLARAHAERHEVEGIIRPRMPPIFSSLPAGGTPDQAEIVEQIRTDDEDEIEQDGEEGNEADESIDSGGSSELDVFGFNQKNDPHDNMKSKEALLETRADEAVSLGKRVASSSREGSPGKRRRVEESMTTDDTDSRELDTVREVQTTQVHPRPVAAAVEPTSTKETTVVVVPAEQMDMKDEGGEDSDEDFKIPELTMEPDTDEEERE